MEWGVGILRLGVTWFVTARPKGTGYRQHLNRHLEG